MIKIQKYMGEISGTIKTNDLNSDEVSRHFTGIEPMDHYPTAIKPGNLSVIAGHYGVGKSTLALDWALAFAKKESRAIAIFSSELLSSEIQLRLMSAETQIDLIKMKYNSLSKEQLRSIDKAIQALADLSLYIEDSSAITLDDLYNECLMLKSDTALGMVVIDNIQLMQNFQLDSEQMMLKLKSLAVELDIPVLVLYQIKRLECEHDGYLDPDIILNNRYLDYADTIYVIHEARKSKLSIIKSI